MTTAAGTSSTPTTARPDGHGTHIAAIAGGRGDNGVGVAGVAWRSRIMPLRVLDQDGAGWGSEVALAVAYAAREGARVANLSLGGPYSRALDDVIELYPELLFVTAAGNDGSDVDHDEHESFPCELPHANLICVAATEQGDKLASYSDYGSSGVDLAAPGSKVLSAAPARRVVFGEEFSGDLFQWQRNEWTIVDGRFAARGVYRAGPLKETMTRAIDTAGLYACRVAARCGCRQGRRPRTC